MAMQPEVLNITAGFLDVADVMRLSQTCAATQVGLQRLLKKLWAVEFAKMKNVKKQNVELKFTLAAFGAAMTHITQATMDAADDDRLIAGMARHMVKELDEATCDIYRLVRFIPLHLEEEDWEDLADRNSTISLSMTDEVRDEIVHYIMED